MEAKVTDTAMEAVAATTGTATVMVTVMAILTFSMGILILPS